MALKKPALFDSGVVQLRLSVIGVVLAIVGPVVVAQAPTGSVQGRVICSDGNVPAPGAEVHLIPLDSLLKQSDGAKKISHQALESSTDFGGNYMFPSVQAGTYVVYVRRDGYSSDFPLVRGVLGRFTLEQQKKLLAEFPQVTVGGGMAREDVVIYRGAAITGRVTIDTGGNPMPITVTATMVSSDLLGDVEGGQGQKPLDFSRSDWGDDRGVYRIAGLPAGKYRIQVRLNEEYYDAVGSGSAHLTVRPTRTGTGGLTVFAPDALTENDAKLVKVGDGDELTGVDVTIPMSRLHSIGGVVTQGGAVVAGADLIIMRGGKSLGASDATSVSDGSYRFDLLPAGTYTVQAKYRDPALSSGPSVIQKITVQLMDNDILDANIDLPTTVQTK